MSLVIELPTRFVIETWWMMPFGQGALLALMAASAYLVYEDSEDLKIALMAAVLFPITLWAVADDLIELDHVRDELKRRDLWDEVSR